MEPRQPLPPKLHLVMVAAVTPRPNRMATILDVPVAELLARISAYHPLSSLLSLRLILLLNEISIFPLFTVHMSFCPLTAYKSLSQKAFPVQLAFWSWCFPVAAVTLTRTG